MKTVRAIFGPGARVFLLLPGRSAQRRAPVMRSAASALAPVIHPDVAAVAPVTRPAVSPRGQIMRPAVPLLEPVMRPAVSPLARVTAALAALAVWLLAGCGDATCAPEPGELCRFAGTGELAFNGDGRKALDTDLYQVSRTRPGQEGHRYLMDYNNHRLRKVDGDGRVRTVAGNGDHDFATEGALATETALENPIDFAFGPEGQLYLVMSHDPRVITVDAGNRVRVVAGTGFIGDSGDGGDAKAAEFDELVSLLAAPDGSLYLSDGRSNRLRVVRPSGVVEAVAGTGERGFSGDGGPAKQAHLSTPQGLALDGDGNLYVADSLNHRVRRIRAQDGVIETVAGTGERGFDGDGGPATSARFAQPAGLAWSGEDGGALYVSDAGNHRIRRIGRDGTVSTLAGTGERGRTGDGGPAGSAQLNGPFHLSLDGDGTNLFFGELQGSSAGIVRLR